MNELRTKYKILTWNILGTDNYLERINHIAEFIKQSGANIALLQETNDDYLKQTIEAFDKIGYVIRRL